MPGLMTLRPLASAAAKAAKAGGKNGVNAGAKMEKVRDDTRKGQGQGVVASPTFARLSRVESVQRAAAHLQQQCRPAPAPQPQLLEQQQRSNLHHQQSSSSVVPLRQQQERSDQPRLQSPLSPRSKVEERKQRASAPWSGDTMRGNGLRIEAVQRMGSAAEYGSSGSEHEPNSVCLAEMVYDYIEEDSEVVAKCGRARCNCGNTSCGGDESPRSDTSDEVRSNLGEIGSILQGLVSSVSPLERNVLALVSITLKKLEDEDEKYSSHEDDDSFYKGDHFSSSTGTDLFEKEDRGQFTKCKNPSRRRFIMSSLRTIGGYNAAICKSRWEHGGGFPGGDYEYIDVITGNSNTGGILIGEPGERIIVDIDFKTQFEIARRTSQYSALLQSLPTVFVGNPARLHQIVNIMCDASKRCLKKTGMHLPPWRKPDYIRAKWFSTYRRTTNPEASLSSASSGTLNGSNGKHIGLHGGTRCDSNFTKDLDTSSHTQAVELRKLRSRDTSSSHYTEPDNVGQHNFIDALEGKVRGANHFGLLLQQAAAASSSTTEWEPPLVLPKLGQRGAASNFAMQQTSLLSDQMRTAREHQQRG